METPLIKPMPGPEPGGRDLTYETHRVAIEDAFAAAGSFDPQDDMPDWAAVVAEIKLQAEETRDFWLASFLARAGARMGSLEIAREGTAMLNGLIENCWDIAHPDVREFGFEARKAPCELLSRPGEFLYPLLNGVMIKHPDLGVCSLARLIRPDSEGTGAGVDGVLQEAISVDQAKSGLDALVSDLRRAEAFLRRFSTDAPELAAAYLPLEEVAGTLYVKSDHDFSTAVDDNPAIRNVKSGNLSDLKISSRAEIEPILTSVIDYYSEFEPTSPIPVILKRCIALISKDFMEIIRDIAPETRCEIEKLLGVHPETGAGR